jgi:hypothetical protein
MTTTVAELVEAPLKNHFDTFQTLLIPPLSGRTSTLELPLVKGGWGDLLTAKVGGGRFLFIPPQSE